MLESTKYPSKIQFYSFLAEQEVAFGDISLEGGFGGKEMYRGLFVIYWVKGPVRILF